MQQNLKISILSTEGIREDFRNSLIANKEFEGDEAKALIQSLVSLDEMIKLKNKKDLKLPSDKVSLMINDGSCEHKLEIMMGENNFSKSIQELIDIGSKDLSRQSVSKETNAEHNDFLEKDDKGKFKNPASKDLIDKVINGGIKTLEMTASLCGEEAQQFFNAFSSVFVKGINQDRISPKENDPTQSKLIQSILENQIKSKSILRNKEKDRIIDIER